MGKNKTILIIDDDAMNREILQELLQMENYHVLLANNGKRGIESARHNIPDMIILDIKMPDMTGFEVCEVIRNDTETQEIPVLIVTGYDDPTDLERGKQVGANGFLSRPFRAEIFITTIQGLFQPD